MSTQPLERTQGIERRPPAPQPRVSALGPIGLYRALRANAITAWRVEAYEEPYLADRNMLGGYVLLNDPDLIRTVLVEKAANYPKDALQLEKLTPAIGRGLLTAEPDSWRLQRRTVRRCSSRRMSPATSPRWRRRSIPYWRAGRIMSVPAPRSTSRAR